MTPPPNFYLKLHQQGEEVCMASGANLKKEKIYTIIHNIIYHKYNFDLKIIIIYPKFYKFYNFDPIEHKILTPPLTPTKLPHLNLTKFPHSPFTSTPKFPNILPLRKERKQIQ